MTTATQEKRNAIKQRIIKIDAWIHSSADCFGECDECHDNGALWIDLDTSEEGEFEYCRSCWNHRLSTLRDKLSRLA